MAADPDRQRLRELTASIRTKRETIKRLQDEVKQQKEERENLKQKFSAA